jgi:c(7)-type cytochrome triheme protein
VKRYRPILVFLALFAIAMASLGAGNWQSLKSDGLHDPSNPSIDVLQEPAEALGVLAPDAAGNNVDWVRALQNGEIAPRPSLHDDREPEILDTNILMRNTNELRYVLFAHKPHTQWMSCEACHESIFVSQADANPITMGKILDGEYCGLCHGAVSFPLTECDRCHNTDSTSVGVDVGTGTEGTQ